MTKGTARRKNAKLPPQIRSRTTRSRGKATTDPAENTQLLTEQLRALGLYAASTLGDGNCLFRALSDQLYGTDSSHRKLRQEICSWIEAHSARYEPFVDDERGLTVHLQCMRQQGTYGGHLELSAFAHMTKRNVKVIQPGLVYVIEWDAGGENKPDQRDSPGPSHPHAEENNTETHTTRRRERKRLERERASTLSSVSLPSEGAVGTPVYVAYHDWEHFSSIRNLRGPHTGPPNIVESLAPEDSDPSPVSVSPVKKKPISTARLVSGPKVKRKPDSKRQRELSSILKEAATPPRTPSQVPLPMSRSPSPPLEVSEEPTTISPIPYPLPQSPPSPSRIYRSPKRTFDESSASSESSQSQPKRLKGSKPPSGSSRLNPDFDLDTPSLTLSAPGSPSSLSELSSLSSRESTPPPPEEPSLSKRERKKLGLPKPRSAVATNGAGKIIIPGGRFKRAGDASTKPLSEASNEAGGEWQRNGTGRLDVRGFRELKI